MAQYVLGVQYALGEGVPKDDVEAYKWLNLSAASGFKGASASREEIAESMNPDQIAEAQKLSRE